MNDMKIVISQKIQKYLQDNKISQKQFLGTLKQKGLDVSQPGLNGWINGTREPRGEAKRILFDVLGISVENTFHDVSVKKYPIMINNILQDDKININTNSQDFINCDFCIIYDKDDMKPLIENGDTLFIKNDKNIVNGNLILVEIDEVIYAKRIYINDGFYTLTSESNSPPQIYSDKSQLHHLGIIKYILKKV